MLSKPTVWLVGGSSPLARAISSELGSDHSIVSFGRSPSCDRFVDLAAPVKTEMAFSQCIQERGIPKAIFFCQRFRPSAEDATLSHFDLLTKATAVELYPLLAINSVLNSLGRVDVNVRMVVFSSTVVLHGQNRTPRFYSMTKSMVSGLMPILTSEVLHIGCTWNCVLLSEFFKGNGAHTISRLRQLARVSKKHVQGQVPRVEDIASFARFLISNTSIYMNGESMVFDGGYIKYGLNA